VESATLTKLSIRAWIEDKILYNEYIGEISMHNVLAMEEQSMSLIKTNKIRLIPVIVILKDMHNTQLNLKLSDWSKIISSVGLIEHLSGVWVVGADETTEKMLNIPNKMFLDNKIKFVSTLAVAQVDAKQGQYSKEAILETK
jgi:hypothetical protein